ncbi:protein SPT2 homolog [Leptidea sinapis]|uniref:protein SPT2 homolog n=1 Tax=Leptidea sinapis TaxID=189913 RepID=UPI0021C327DE|nr:protein SPT2 homolog [Leptidea sinapis]
MEFRETLLAAQRNQQQKSSVDSYYYKAKFDPPKKEQKAKDRLSANIQKFLAKKDEEERQKRLEAQRKREELFAMRDPKALRKIQKTLKVIKSANKSVIADAIDRDNTAFTRDGPDQPDQDDYGYESQAAAAIYEKMMQKYSKLPDEPKFPSQGNSINKDLNGTRERVKHALRHEDDPVPHKRKRRSENNERETSPLQKYEPEKERDKKPDKPKNRKPAPPPLDFNELLKLAEQKKREPVDVVNKKAIAEPEPDRLMTKKQKREHEEEMARRQRRQERIDAEKAGGRKSVNVNKEKPVDKEYKREVPSGFGRIPKIGAQPSNKQEKSTVERERSEKQQFDKQRIEKMQREKETARVEKNKTDSDKEKIDKLKAERDRIDREMERLNREREKLDKNKVKLESTIEKNRLEKVDRTKLNKEDALKQDFKKNIGIKTQNTYRIDKNSNERNVLPQKSDKLTNGHSTKGKPVPKNKDDFDRERMMREKLALAKRRALIDAQRSNGHVRNDKNKQMPDTSRSNAKISDDKRSGPSNSKQPGASKPAISNNFDFDKHVNALKNGKKLPPGAMKKRPHPDDLKKKPKRRMVDSDSEYDSEMDDFIDDGEEELDYSSAIKEIFGYDKSKYRDIDDDDDPAMESNFAQQQREEYISKKLGIMEDLEDMRLEAMEKKKKGKRRISDD